MAFKKATKHQLKLRFALAGPSGSGKTWTSLAIATALAGDKRVAVIDTERGSASKYAREFDFDVQELNTFSPQSYVDAIHEAERDGSYGVLIIDSLSHAWNGTGGLLELVDNIARRKYQGNTFAAWKDATPLQNALIDAITGSPLHIIVTMRSKQEYTLEKDERTGKSSPKKHGMAPVQRDGMEYEFDVAVDMDIDNTMIVQKSRCSELSGQVISKPGANVASILQKWLDDGEPQPLQQTRSEPQQAAKSSQPANVTPLSQHATSASSPSQQESPTVNELYKRGKVMNVWTNEQVFFAAVSAMLSRPFGKESKWSVEDRRELSSILDEKALQETAQPVG